MLPQFHDLHRWFSRTCVVMAFFAIALVARGDSPATQPIDHAKMLIVLAGDSTVTDSIGWGKGFEKLLSDNITCKNMARAGRSSRNYISQGWWGKCLDLKPAYILIQFGHNDMRKGEGRETDPQTTYKQFMTEYVDQAREVGAKPILVTSMSRRIWGDDGKIHSNLQEYVDVVKQIGAEKKVPLIDLHARSIELYEKLGKDGCNDISPKLDDGFDATHLNPKGSEIVGKIIADELKKAVPELAANLK